MRMLCNLVWLLLLIGACGLCCWFSYGWWRFGGDSMIERDSIRFGRVPVTLSLVWVLLLLIAPLLSVAMRHRKRESDSA